MSCHAISERVGRGLTTHQIDDWPWLSLALSPVVNSHQHQLWKVKGHNRLLRKYLVAAASVVLNASSSEGSR